MAQKFSREEDRDSMPKKLDDCVKRLMAQGKSKSQAYAICTDSTGYKRKKGGGWVKKRK